MSVRHWLRGRPYDWRWKLRLSLMGSWMVPLLWFVIAYMWIDAFFYARKHRGDEAP